MTEDGKAAAKRAVEALEASAGSTNVRVGLDEAAKVLEGSRHRNDVAGVIFLSDGRDYTTSDSSVLLPEFLVRDSGWRSTPVHTFGLGPDVDAAAMHNIAEASRHLLLRRGPRRRPGRVGAVHRRTPIGYCTGCLDGG
jgi:hypothetical protein